MKATKPIWLVTRTTGEYSDRREWVVCAFHTEAEAEAHARRCQNRAAEIGRMIMAYGTNEHDPQMTSDYNGVRYDHQLTELHESQSAP